MPQPKYVQERIESLNSIDRQLTSSLLHASQAVAALAELKRGEEMKHQFEMHARNFYQGLEEATVSLRNEIKFLDDNVGTRLLPINVNKKASDQDDDKLREQLTLLEKELS
ncbi:LAFE_0C09714g1_1 [Lachancea fermentati]|uniref:Mediator of RNA polymerase II transcription subunit 11 n=1 Tax=Lachancea fermentati TaxID=4955 RepID=A0A1G4MA03_LACFM|nr:LAFE_0C09714g1_1 [Lachancea fermentati]